MLSYSPDGQIISFSLLSFPRDCLRNLGSSFSSVAIGSQWRKMKIMDTADYSVVGTVTVSLLNVGQAGIQSCGVPADQAGRKDLGKDSFVISNSQILRVPCTFLFLAISPHSLYGFANVSLSLSLSAFCRFPRDQRARIWDLILVSH